MSDSKRIYGFEVTRTLRTTLWVWGTPESAREDAEEMLADAVEACAPDDDLFAIGGNPEPNEYVWTGGPEGTDLRFDNPAAPWRLTQENNDE